MGNVRVKGPDDDGPVEATTTAPHGDREPIAPAPERVPTMRTRDSILAFQKAIDASAICRTCGKRLLVQNVAAFAHRGGFVPERVSVETHCTCEGGPAHELVPGYRSLAGGAR